MTFSKKTSIIDVEFLEKNSIYKFLSTLSEEDFLNLSREFNYFNEAGALHAEYFHPLGCFDMDVPENLDSKGQDKLCVIYGWNELSNKAFEALLIWNHKGTNQCRSIDISGAFRGYPTNSMF